MYDSLSTLIAKEWVYYTTKDTSYFIPDSIKSNVYHIDIWWQAYLIKKDTDDIISTGLKIK